MLSAPTALTLLNCGPAAARPAVTLGRCAAAGCDNYFVDQSRNRTRRFCSNACASRTTVAAHRARTAKKS
ncbi:CGNR zinc finger domain-containing protein [Streptomyces sp. NPDC004011]